MTPTSSEPIYVVGNMLLYGVVYGTLAAAFAAWYRDFLRGMQDRGKQRRAEQEAKERDRRRDERQEAASPPSGRPSPLDASRRGPCGARRAADPGRRPVARSPIAPQPGRQ